jgi:serine/threonine protein kinase
MKFCTECYATAAEDAAVCPVAECHGALRREPLLECVIDGRYAPEAVHRAGGMGVLLRARHLHLGTVFAIKVLDLQQLGKKVSLEITQRFRNEATLVARLRHPNIVEVSDYGTAPDGRTYIVMEFLEGRDLDHELEEGGPFSPRRILDVMRPVCEALAWTHRHNVVHRDIKPANIMLARIGGEECVKLLDFGVAKMMEPVGTGSTPITMVVGTPEYMAPEQIQPWNAPLAPPTDIYALGVTVFEMVAGETPFRHTTLAHIIQAKMRCAFVPLAERRPGRGWEALDEVVRQAVSVDPADRQQTALVFLDDVERALTAVSGEALSASGSRIRAPAVPVPKRRDAALSATMPVVHDLLTRDVRVSGCGFCRSEIPAGAMFCPYCGGKLPDAAEDTFIGALIDGTYRLDERVRPEQEPMAYRATNVRLDQVVEVKLTVTGGDESGARARLVRQEARLGAQLDHPGLAATLDGGFDGALGACYVVTEWLDGPAVAERIRGDDRLPIPLIRSWLLAMLDTLDYLHCRNTVYGALHPENVVVIQRGVDETPVLLDLHAARGGAELSRMLTLGRLGAPHYMAPEQIWSPDGGTHRIDVYAAGAMAYLLLTGEAPYSRLGAREAMARMRAGRLTSPRRLAPDRVSDGWEAVVLRAMAHSPADRYDSANEMAAEVRRAV